MMHKRRGLAECQSYSFPYNENEWGQQASVNSFPYNENEWGQQASVKRTTKPHKITLKLSHALDSKVSESIKNCVRETN